MSHYQGSVPDTATRTADWLAVAPCSDDPEAMFPGTLPDDIEYAKGFCRRCPSVDRCLSWALNTGEEHGVWGGLSEAERRKIRRGAARRINLDDYTGTRETRPKAATLQESWASYTQPRDNHLLWTGPKVMNRPGTKKQVTANRLSFYLDRGRWPEGDTKRNCNQLGCVKPQHLDDRRERAERVPDKDTYQALLDANTVRRHDGHLAWTGPRKVSVQAREFTPRQLAFIADRGRRSRGAVRTGCTVAECVLAAHLSDQEERGGCGTRIGYQWHRRRGEDACQACRDANTDADNRLRRTGTTKVLAVAV